MKPLLKPDQLAKWESTKDQIPDSPLKSFLYDTSLSPLKTVADVQAVISEYVLAIREFRSFLKANVESQMVINLNPHVFEEKIRKDYISDCQVVEADASMTVRCSSKEAAQVRLNSADFVGLAQMASGELFYFGFMNSYTLDGVDGLAQFDPKGEKSSEESSEKRRQEEERPALVHGLVQSRPGMMPGFCFCRRRISQAPKGAWP